MIIDTHSHMYSDTFDEDRTECMERALEKGISKTLLPNIDSASIEPLKKMLKQWPDQTVGMMGLHPCSVSENFEKELNLIKTELYSGDYVAVGEIGLDFFWDKTFSKEQFLALETQISWAKDLQLPIVLHVRDSFEAVFQILDSVNTEGLSGVFHCFTGNFEQAKKALSYENFYLGVGGVLTFKNSGLDQVVESIPLERLLLETDAPYLAPVPHRGKRNETSYTKNIAEKLATVKNVDYSTVCRETTKNAKKLFKLR